MADVNYSAGVRIDVKRQESALLSSQIDKNVETVLETGVADAPSVLGEEFTPRHIGHLRRIHARRDVIWNRRTVKPSLPDDPRRNRRQYLDTRHGAFPQRERQRIAFRIGSANPLPLRHRTTGIILERKTKLTSRERNSFATIACGKPPCGVRSARRVDDARARDGEHDAVVARQRLKGISSLRIDGHLEFVLA